MSVIIACATYQYSTEVAKIIAAVKPIFLLKSFFPKKNVKKIPSVAKTAGKNLEANIFFVDECICSTNRLLFRASKYQEKIKSSKQIIINIV